jgi:uncharacterized membrane protein
VLTRTKVLAAIASVLAIVAVVAAYRVLTAGRAEARDITERIAAAMAAGDRDTLASEPTLCEHQGTADWLATRGPALANGYRISVRRNGAGGFQLMPLEMVSHIGVIHTAAGDISLGFWLDPSDGNLKFVTAASTIIGLAEAGPASDIIRVSNQATEPRAAPDGRKHP